MHFPISESTMVWYVEVVFNVVKRQKKLIISTNQYVRYVRRKVSRGETETNRLSNKSNKMTNLEEGVPQTIKKHRVASSLSSGFAYVGGSIKVVRSRRTNIDFKVRYGVLYCTLYCIVMSSRSDLCAC